MSFESWDISKERFKYLDFYFDHFINDCTKHVNARALYTDNRISPKIYWGEIGHWASRICELLVEDDYFTVVNYEFCQQIRFGSMKRFEDKWVKSERGGPNKGGVKFEERLKRLVKPCLDMRKELEAIRDEIVKYRSLVNTVIERVNEEMKEGLRKCTDFIVERNVHRITGSRSIAPHTIFLVNNSMYAGHWKGILESGYGRTLAKFICNLDVGEIYTYSKFYQDCGNIAQTEHARRDAQKDCSKALKSLFIFWGKHFKSVSGSGWRCIKKMPHLKVEQHESFLKM